MTGQWVRVEFYGLVPDGQAVVDVKPDEVAATLGRAFGFTHVDGLTVVDSKPPPSALDPAYEGVKAISRELGHECQERFALGREVLGCALLPGHEDAHWDERGFYWSPEPGMIPLIGAPS